MAKKKRAKKGSGGGKRPIEQYEHRAKKRVNNPPVGLATPQTDPDQPTKEYAYDPHLDPQLVWAGKAEQTSFEVPTVSLHAHERISAHAIVMVGWRQEVEPLVFRIAAWSIKGNLTTRRRAELREHPKGRRNYRHVWRSQRAFGPL